MKHDRLSQIKHLLMQDKKVNNVELAEQFGVSLATIRRDLDQLERSGSIRRIYGGAEIIDNVSYPSELDNIPLWTKREQTSRHEKEEIARRIVERIPKSCTVYIDSGTSAYEVAKLLTGRTDLTILTNSLRAAVLLGSYPDMTAYCIGGMIKYELLATAGFLATQDLSFFPNIDVSVLSADGFDPSWGLREHSMETALLKKAVVEHSKTVIAALDHTKFGASATASFCRTKQISILITDHLVPPETIEYLRKLGLTVIIADTEK